MDRIITEKEMQTLLKAQQGELDAVNMYNALAKVVRDEKDAETFKRLAAEEGRHAAVFKELTGQILKPGDTLARLVPKFYKIVGKRILYPVIAKFEYGAAKTYEPVAARFPEVESVKADEKRHGDTVKALLK